MKYIALLIALFVALLVMLVASFIRQRRGLKQKTVESLGKDLWKEIEDERVISLEKGKRFRKILHDKEKE